jgi:hypothetical protein
MNTQEKTVLLHSVPHIGEQTSVWENKNKKLLLPFPSGTTGVVALVGVLSGSFLSLIAIMSEQTSVWENKNKKLLLPPPFGEQRELLH